MHGHVRANKVWLRQLSCANCTSVQTDGSCMLKTSLEPGSFRLFRPHKLKEPGSRLAKNDLKGGLP